MMHKLSAANWVLVMQLMLNTMHSMDKEVALSGWTIYSVLVMSKQFRIAPVQDLENMIATMEKMLV